MRASDGESSRAASAATAMLPCASEKAGMRNVDRTEINRRIAELSRGSRFHENEERKAIALMRQAQALRAELARSPLTPHIEVVARTLKERIVKTPYARTAQGDLNRRCESRTDAASASSLGANDAAAGYVHIDMDAFYCAVETRDFPDAYPPSVPMAVGGPDMICTSNYAARTFGVRAAMPGFIATALCPELRIVRPRMSRYAEAGAAVRRVLAQYDAQLISGSWDEASLCMRGHLASRSSATYSSQLKATVLAEMRAAVAAATGGLTCSGGWAPTRQLAKMASEERKPDGQFVLEEREVQNFIGGKPVRKVPGIGKTRERILMDVFGIKTCADVISSIPTLLRVYSKPAVGALALAALGHDSERRQGPQPARQSVSKESSFAPETNCNVLLLRLQALSRGVARSLAQKRLEARHVGVRVKFADFSVKTAGRNVTHRQTVSSAADIFECAQRLFLANAPPGVPVRMLGVRAAALTDVRARERAGARLLGSLAKQAPPPLTATSEEGVDSVSDEEFERPAELSNDGENGFKSANITDFTGSMLDDDVFDDTGGGGGASAREWKNVSSAPEVIAETNARKTEKGIWGPAHGHLGDVWPFLRFPESRGVDAPSASSSPRRLRSPQVQRIDLDASEVNALRTTGQSFQSAGGGLSACKGMQAAETPTRARKENLNREGRRCRSRGLLRGRESGGPRLPLAIVTHAVRVEVVAGSLRVG